MTNTRTIYYFACDHGDEQAREHRWWGFCTPMLCTVCRARIAHYQSQEVDADNFEERQT